MTMLTQAEKRRLLRPIAPAPPVAAVEIIVRRMPQQSDNRQAKITFGATARELLPHLASLWDNGK